MNFLDIVLRKLKITNPHVSFAKYFAIFNFAVHNFAAINLDTFAKFRDAKFFNFPLGGHSDRSGPAVAATGRFYRRHWVNQRYRAPRLQFSLHFG